MVNYEDRRTTMEAPDDEDRSIKCAISLDHDCHTFYISLVSPRAQLLRGIYMLPA